jgi:N-acetylglucosaminyldiphosphoundecaprenol N-acetyl-beta-D-mannosaminyltransferase
MAGWLTPDKHRAVETVVHFNQRADQQLRAVDFTLAGLVLILLAAPIALGLLLGRPRAMALTGCNGQVFKRWQIDFSNRWTGRLLRSAGVGSWPVLFNILKGEMAWVGPHPLLAAAKPEIPTALTQVRPGLVSSWELRRRTAVDFGSELDANLEYVAQRGLKHDLGILLRAFLVIWLPSPREISEGRLRVGDVFFDNVNMAQALDRIGAMLDGSSSQQVSFVNPACVNIAARDRGYRRILARAALVLPDGIGIKIAADLLGVGLKQNVNGTDLFPRLCQMLEARSASLFLLGGQPGIAEKVAAVIQESWPRLHVAGLRNGYFDTSQEGEVAAQITASGADVLLVARGVPMQDIFIDRHLHQLGVKVAFGVGGLFDFVSGRINRAPAWMRDSGLEWIYRLLQEPSRMWRRYLVGNFTFLGRILLQRIGLRRPASDDIRHADRSVATAATGIPNLRTVLFATAMAPHDIPVSEDFPAALLPMGCSTLIERALEQLSNVGVRQIDLVVSSRPEEMRRLLGNGERWGLTLRWHLAKDAATPYGILQSLVIGESERILIGHADRWIADDAMAALVERDQVLTLASDEAGVRWAGWGCATRSMLNAISPFNNESTLGSLLCGGTSELLVLAPDQYIQVGNSAQLMHAQKSALTAAFIDQVPATWLRAPWGAYSPDAVVQAGALIEGPVLIGPGCLISSGASIGPATVLTSDVVISSDSIVRNSVVLPHTYVGTGLELDETIVNAHSVQHLRLGVRTVLPASDGLLLDLQKTPGARTSWFARIVAAIACVAILPWLIVDTALRRSRGMPLRWSQRPIVLGLDPQSGGPRLKNLRCATSDLHEERALLTNCGAWLDIVAGNRRWFGARPRSESEWYALSRDWQLLLANTPVGCLHAPAWSEAQGENPEARAAADVFFAVNHGLAQRMRMVLAALRASPAGDPKPV